MTTSFRYAVRLGVLLAGVAAASPAFAQLDPLLYVKTTQPYIILAVDVSQRMQVDAEGTYYDPGLYTKTSAAHETVLGLQASEAAKSYRRKYLGFAHEAAANTFRSTRIDAVGDLEAGYATFFERTRLAIARRGLIRAITDNQASARFGLVKLRQAAVTLPAAGNASPAMVSDPLQQTPTDTAAAGEWKITRTTVATSNSTQAVSGLLTSPSTPGANATILSTLGKDIGAAGALLPGGIDSASQVDAPVGLLLDDARAHASTLITADAAVGGCTNTVVVLVVGGAEGTINAQNIAAKASTFLNVNGRRVPIYVIALFPTASEATTLRQVATNSGGQYYEITAAMVDATTPGAAVPELVRGVNTAVQHAFAKSTTFNTAPTGALPFGPYAEFQSTSPIIGTVNLRGASKIGASGLPESLPDSETYLVNGSREIPQRSNVMVTSGFVLPGFDARLRAFRVYKPVADATKPTGYKFVQDGSRLWVASTPAAGSRNIFTVLPGASDLVPFASGNANIDQHLGVSDPADLITWVRQQPLGAVVGSTPAFLTPPSLDPPPDTDYLAFAAGLAKRRSLIFVGGNDGMLHALDARTGLEVWAFIPFNLLPKLRALRSGQSMDAFNYFVDSSPKIADVKVGSDWRTYLFFGQGPGGTFYNTLDVTLEKLPDAVSDTSTNDGALLSYFASKDSIPWKWSFPRNTSFDSSLAPYGELSASSASAAEQTVGETWSDPAVGQVVDQNGLYVMITGSGFLKHSVQALRRTGVTRAGTSLYVIDVATGTVLASRDVGADANAETVDDCRVANDCRKMKNALQMDPVATGVADQRHITKVYIGDLDGKVWRFAISMSGGSVALAAPAQLYSAGADYPLFSSMATVNVGSTNQYIFVGTGSDLLPSNGVNQSYNLLVLLDSGGATASKSAEILLEAVNWPAAAGGDEKVTAFPAVAGDIVFFTTTTYSPTTPCTPFSANLYAFTFIGGPAYDTNGDGSLSTGTSGGKKTGSTSGDSQKVFTQAGLRATAPFVVDQHLVFSAGGQIQMFGDPEDFNNGVGQAGVRILSWRLVK